jgi:hypothetical protein
MTSFLQQFFLLISTLSMIVCDVRRYPVVVHAFSPTPSSCAPFSSANNKKILSTATRRCALFNTIQNESYDLAVVGENIALTSTTIMTRRQSMTTTMKAGSAAAAAATILGSFPSYADTESSTTTTVSPKQILNKFASIPTFVIATSDGVPFMIFNGKDGATGYFFLSYNVAKQALLDAQQKDSASGKKGTIWDTATVRVVPLSVALQLALVERARTASNSEDGVRGMKLPRTIGDIVPSEEGIADAKIVDAKNNPNKWNSKGRVPIFYFATTDDDDDGKNSKWYFNVADLKRDHPGEVGEIRVIEMMDVFRRTKDWGTLQDLTPVPVQETNQVALQLIKNLPSDAKPYSLQQAYLVSSAK